MEQSLSARLRACATHALMDAARSTVLEAADEVERLRGSMVEQRFCEPPVAGSTPVAGFSARDHFAAAALSGLLAQGDDGSFSEQSYVRSAYRWADVMLRERAQSGGDSVSVEPERQEKRAEASAEPVAWAVVSDSTEQIDCEFVYPDEATAGDVALDSNGSIVPLYRQPQPTLTDEEREAVAYFAVIDGPQYLPTATHAAATLRGLLERTK